MTVTTTNLLQGPADIFVAPFGTLEPTDADAVLDVAWINSGGTNGGAKLTVDQKYSDLMVDQIAMAVGARLVSLAATVTVSLAEGTLANLRAAFNMAAGAATTLELDPTITNAEPNYAGVLLQGQRPGGGNRRVILRRTLSTEKVDLAFAKDGMTLIPVTFSVYYVSDAIKPFKIDDTPGA